MGTAAFSLVGKNGGVEIATVPKRIEETNRREVARTMSELLDDWLTPGEITQRFGITTQAVRMAIQRGRISEADMLTKGGIRFIRRTTAERMWGKSK